MEQRFTRMKNDVNGNPIYYIGIYELADLAGVSVEELPELAKKVGFKKIPWQKVRNRLYCAELQCKLHGRTTKRPNQRIGKLKPLNQC